MRTLSRSLTKRKRSRVMDNASTGHRFGGLGTPVKPCPQEPCVECARGTDTCDPIMVGIGEWYRERNRRESEALRLRIAASRPDAVA